jgi:hypothetical protein
VSSTARDPATHRRRSGESPQDRHSGESRNPFCFSPRPAAQSAEAANQAAQQANQRLDAIEGRVQQLEQAPARSPRG